jgi:pyruvate/2-oxoglutarate dehydrogenase complex dihydrolipoamide acyltransferase (E2) component
MAVIQKIEVPLIAVNDTSLTVVDINFQNKGYVKKGDIIMVFETSKTTYEVIAEVDGYIKYLCEINNDYAVNTVVAELYEAAEEIKVTEKIISAKEETIEINEQEGKLEQLNYKGEILISNEAKKLILDHKIDPIVFNGFEMVTKNDILKYLNPNSFSTIENITRKETKTIKNFIVPNDSTVTKITNNKKIEIDYLSSVQETGLTSTISIDISTNGLFANINKNLKYFKNGILPILIYETSRLLIKFPLLNAFYNNQSIYQYKNIHIGFAIDIDKGLKVVKIENTNNLTISEVEDAILLLSNQYLEDKIPMSNLLDITFTITDLSNEGVSFFKPLVNKNNSAILGISAIDQILQRFNTSITFDHRVTEGKYIAQFLKELKDRIESYAFNDNLKNTHYTCYKCFKNLQEDLSNVGLLPIVTPQGKSAFICQTCWNGL